MLLTCSIKPYFQVSCPSVWFCSTTKSAVCAATSPPISSQTLRGKNVTPSPWIRNISPRAILFRSCKQSSMRCAICGSIISEIRKAREATITKNGATKWKPWASCLPPPGGQAGKRPASKWMTTPLMEACFCKSANGLLPRNIHCPGRTGRPHFCLSLFWATAAISSPPSLMIGAISQTGLNTPVLTARPKFGVSRICTLFVGIAASHFVKS